MRRILALLGIAGALGFAGCTSHASSVTTNPQVQQDTARAERIFNKCDHGNPFVLLNKTGRQAFVACAIPPQNRKAATRYFVDRLFAEGGSFQPGVEKRRIERAAQQTLVKYS